MKSIISVSRRTDIPAFYTNWFLERLQEGYVRVTHPYSKEKTVVSLKTETTGAFVFWSKNFSPLLKKLEQIETVTKNLFFHFTITGANELEPHTPNSYDAIKDCIYLSKRYSPKHIIWRYDPICITSRLPFELYEERFIKYAERLNGFITMCYISFVYPYRKVLKNFSRHTNHQLIELSEEKKRKLASRLSIIAKRYKMTLYACCNDYLLSDTIEKAHCINGQYLSGIFEIPLQKTKAPSRQECACTKSIDIGTYNTCHHGCIYCYA